MGARWRRSDVWCVPGAAPRRSACLSMLGPRPPLLSSAALVLQALHRRIPLVGVGPSQRHRLVLRSTVTTKLSCCTLSPCPVPERCPVSCALPPFVPSSRCSALWPRRSPVLCTPTANLSPNKLWRLRAARMAVHALRPADAGRKPRAKRASGASAAWRWVRRRRDFRQIYTSDFNGHYSKISSNSLDL